MWPLWPKSPRWLYSVGKYKEGEKVVAEFAKFTKTDLTTYANNGKFGEVEFYNELRRQVSRTKQNENIVPAKETETLIEKDATESTGKTYSIISLFTNGKWIAFVTINIMVQFVVIGLCFTDESSVMMSSG